MKDSHAVEPGLYVWDDVIPIFMTILEDWGRWSEHEDPHERRVLVLGQDGKLSPRHMNAAMWEKIA